ncbi:MAG: B12-binding domain-containing radical SAM protein [Dehalococcoidia bacterium]|nr:B12-binding domain-containing radical SAM protein [Dehalococcoidia bacterium]
MSKRKLLLINPVNPHRAGLAVSLSSRFPPLGLGVLAALTPDNWEVALIDENFKPFEYQEADLVGLTAFTAAAPRAYEIASIYKEQDITTVMGGIHASMLPHEALRYVDSVVIGEAESVWSQVIADFMAGGIQQIYQGEWLGLAGMVQPRRDLFNPEYVFGTIQTSRGCPMDCEFCSVTVFNGHRYRQRLVSEVLDELESIPQKRVFFVDDNIIGYGKATEERAVALFKGMIERGIKKDWWCQASINFADNEELLEYAAKSGCRMVFLGVEAEDVDALEEVGKKLNLKKGVGSYKEAFHSINRHGIAVLGGFIYGMDSDTPEKLRHRTDYILHSGIDAVQMSYLTPLPGTRLFNRLRDAGRLLYANFPKDWEYYDLTGVVYKPALMTIQEFSAVTLEGARRIYSGWSIRRKFARTLHATKNLAAASLAYGANISYQNLAAAKGVLRS